MCQVKAWLGSRDLIARKRATASGRSARAARPYTVSVGRAITPPASRIAAARARSSTEGGRGWVPVAGAGSPHGSTSAGAAWEGSLMTPGPMVVGTGGACKRRAAVPPFPDDDGRVGPNGASWREGRADACSAATLSEERRRRREPPAGRFVQRIGGSGH